MLLIAVIFTAGSALPAVSANAQQPPSSPSSDESSEPSDKQRFRELGRIGAKAFADKDYAAAEAAFKEAYQIKPVPNLLYNIGRAVEKQGDFEEATAFYEKFVNEPDVELKARQDALQRLKTLREVLALREEGEEVDREQVEANRDDKRQDEPGLAATEPGPDTQGGANTGGASPGRNAPAGVERDYTLAYVFGVTGVATLIGSGVFAGLAAAEKSDFDEAATLAERRSAADTGHTYTTVADSMLVAGGVFTAAGLYFWATAPGEAPAGQARLVPSLGPSGASVTFSLDF